MISTSAVGRRLDYSSMPSIATRTMQSLTNVGLSCCSSLLGHALKPSAPSASRPVPRARWGNGSQRDHHDRQDRRAPQGAGRRGFGRSALSGSGISAPGHVAPRLHQQREFPRFPTPQVPTGALLHRCSSTGAPPQVSVLHYSTGAIRMSHSFRRCRWSRRPASPRPAPTACPTARIVQETTVAHGIVAVMADCAHAGLHATGRAGYAGAAEDANCVGGRAGKPHCAVEVGCASLYSDRRWIG